MLVAVSRVVSPHATTPKSKNTPTKSEAKASGRYRPVPRFQIVTYSGRETNTGPERRFSDTLYPGDVEAFMGRAKEQARQREYVGGQLVGKNRGEQIWFDRYVDKMGKRPFSVDTLREWKERQNG